MNRVIILFYKEYDMKSLKEIHKCIYKINMVVYICLIYYLSMDKEHETFNQKCKTF